MKHPASDAGTLAIYACHAVQLSNVGGCVCTGVIAPASNNGDNVKLRLTRIAHAIIRLIRLRVSLASCSKNDTALLYPYNSLIRTSVWFTS